MFVLWSFDGVFPEVVDGVQAMAFVVALFCAVNLDGLLGASGKAANDDDEAAE
jgi:hypothetical protein